VTFQSLCILVGKPQGTNSSEDIGADGRILEWPLRSMAWRDGLHS
jgi:hypothetical protein